MDPKKYVRLCCRGHVDVTKAQRWQVMPARTELDLEQLEAAYRILDLYIWLSFRMEAAFRGALLKPFHKPSAASCVAWIGRVGCTSAHQRFAPGKAEHAAYTHTLGEGIQTASSSSAARSVVAHNHNGVLAVAFFCIALFLALRSAQHAVLRYRPGGSREAESIGGSPHRGGSAPSGTEQQKQDYTVRWYPPMPANGPAFLKTCGISSCVQILVCTSTVLTQDAHLHLFGLPYPRHISIRQGSGS